ncbi:hypothetical protein TH66_13060 [Carbonactinospora thermoautotrophica]|uniref:Recombinase family protein n=2 Tax=Carbonactinospora thermoautotrophica TaxID=1469144 RepID=A0A132N2A0_9ACTN|nr:recombinase family protein [Carbonactinospora thermoautotrophica]KWX03722.1 hypothetical protein TH66_13060 [Carbonactinospora thermoautotrophica]KWX08176.1 hypothetical protein TR74_16105 [Carbonactinospora thermoautotrophica]
MASKASAYIRLSHAAGDGNLSRDGMEDDIRAACARIGAEVGPVHVDDGRSGAIRNRPEFLAWLDDAREGRVDVLATWHVDRLTREGLQAAAMILDVVEGKDTTTGRVVRPPVRFIDCHGLDSEDEFAFRIRFVLEAEGARKERERIRARNAALQQRLIAARRWYGGHVPFGYRVVPHPDGAGKALEIEPSEADALRAAAEMILSGASPGAAARWLNEQGVKPRRGKSWTRPSLIACLTGNAILGRITYRGAPVRGDDGYPVQAWPQIITPAEHAALRAILRAGEGSPIRKGGRPHARLLSGVLKCSGCSRPLRVSPPNYRCAAASDGFTCPRPVAISAERADQTVEQLFLGAYGRLPLVIRRVVAADNGLAEVEDAIAATLAELGQNPSAELFARLQSLHAERERRAALPTETRVEMVRTDRTLSDEWQVRDVPGRRSLLLDAIAAATVEPATGRRFDPKRIRIYWREGPADFD